MDNPGDNTSNIAHNHQDLAFRVPNSGMTAQTAFGDVPYQGSTPIPLAPGVVPNTGLTPVANPSDEVGSGMEDFEGYDGEPVPEPHQPEPEPHQREPAPEVRDKSNRPSHKKARDDLAPGMEDSRWANAPAKKPRSRVTKRVEKLHADRRRRLRKAGRRGHGNAKPAHHSPSRPQGQVVRLSPQPQQTPGAQRDRDRVRFDPINGNILVTEQEGLTVINQHGEPVCNQLVTMPHKTMGVTAVGPDSLEQVTSYITGLRVAVAAEQRVTVIVQFHRDRSAGGDAQGPVPANAMAAPPPSAAGGRRPENATGEQANASQVVPALSLRKDAWTDTRGSESEVLPGCEEYAFRLPLANNDWVQSVHGRNGIIGVVRNLFSNVFVYKRDVPPHCPGFRELVLGPRHVKDWRSPTFLLRLNELFNMLESYYYDMLEKDRYIDFAEFVELECRHVLNKRKGNREQRSKQRCS
ncbi:hypothetical protein F4819DRAFT_171147 [Hypoxylon fuscum]|nr:hypothetical protein F4819DRAFT_171147 [Hypoxylon fuscum]